MQEQKIVFTSLGQAILDDVYFVDGSCMKSVLGGAGTYAILGARLFFSTKTKLIGWTFRTGPDLPSSTRDAINAWGLNLHIREEEGEHVTRSLVRYQSADLALKTLEYITPPLRTNPDHLQNTPLLTSTSLHILARPDQLSEYVPRLRDLRQSYGIRDKPFIIWEPSPSSCVADNLEAFQSSLKYVDVFSPNHFELGRITGIDVQGLIDCRTVDHMCDTLLEPGAGSIHGGIIVLRAASQGCYVKEGLKPSKNFPPYYSRYMSDGCIDPSGVLSHASIVDTTGAGNMFLGAFAAGFIHSGNIDRAAAYGNVGSSFALEQFGMPVLALQDGKELWNGQDVFERLRKYETSLR